MAKNNEGSSKTTKDLRDHLFKQIEKLNDPNCDLAKELEKAKAMASIGNVIVNSVKIEIDFLRVTESKTGKKQKEIGNGE